MPIPSTDTHIENFFNYLRFEKRYSLHTLISYQTDLLQFTKYLEEEFEEVLAETAKTAFIKSWLAHLKSDGKNTSKTINRKISTLKSFYRFLVKQGVVHQTPMATVISPKVSKRLPAFVEEKNTETLFNYVEFSNDWKGKTDRLILLLFYSTGIRLNELINLKEKHIDAHYGQIKVLGKGNKERLIPVSNELMGELQDYMRQKPVTGQTDNIFITGQGKPLYAKYVYNSVKKYLGAVTTLEKKSPHVLRHTFATHLMNNGAELNAVKELLGHSSLASTQVYTHNTIEKLKEVHKLAHPKA